MKQNESTTRVTSYDLVLTNLTFSESPDFVTWPFLFCFSSETEIQDNVSKDFSMAQFFANLADTEDWGSAFAPWHYLRESRPENCTPPAKSLFMRLRQKIYLKVSFLCFDFLNIILEIIFAHDFVRTDYGEMITNRSGFKESSIL